jgi:hypothetical protein
MIVSVAWQDLSPARPMNPVARDASFSGPLCGPHAPLIGVGTVGRRKAARKPCVQPMNANDDTPCNGENVSDAQFDKQQYLRDHSTYRVRAIIDELRHNVINDEPSVAELSLRVERCRYQLEMLEAVLDEELAAREIESVTDLKELKQ